MQSNGRTLLRFELENKMDWKEKIERKNHTQKNQNERKNYISI